MDIFGDDEPEDGWHPEDPPEEQVRNLRLRLALLLAADPIDGDLLAELAVYRAVLERIQDRRGTDREILRYRELDEDIRFVVVRLTTDG